MRKTRISRQQELTCWYCYRNTAALFELVPSSTELCAWCLAREGVINFPTDDEIPNEIEFEDWVQGDRSITKADLIHPNEYIRYYANLMFHS